MFLNSKNIVEKQWIYESLGSTIFGSFYKLEDKRIFYSSKTNLEFKLFSNMILELGQEEEKGEIREDFEIKEADGADIKVYEKGIIGQTDYPCIWAKYDKNGEYIVSCYNNG